LQGLKILPLWQEYQLHINLTTQDMFVESQALTLAESVLKAASGVVGTTGSAAAVTGGVGVVGACEVAPVDFE